MKKISMNWNKIAKMIEIILLIGFFMGAAVLTELAQKNYNRNLTVVKTVNPDSLCIEHNVEFQGRLINENGINKIKFNMEEYARAIDDQMQVNAQVWNIVLNYSRDSEEKLCISESLGESYSNHNGMLDEINGKNAYVYVDQLPDSWSKEDNYLVRVNYLDSRKKYVIPSACILYDEDEQKSYVFTISEEAKIWGTEYSLKKVYVKVVETNGTLSALEDTPGKEVIEDSQANYYQGMLVKY